MWGDRFWGRYWGNRYWNEGGAGAPVAADNTAGRLRRRRR